jgi:hypothetical protein
MVNTIQVNSGMSYSAVLRSLGRFGELRVENVYQKNGIHFVQFRERTLSDFFKEKFSKDGLEEKKAREEVVKALEPLIKKSLYPDQLLQNIQDRFEHGKGVSGRGLKRDYQPVEAGKRPMPLQGGTITAISQGHSVQIIQANPAKIKCSHAVLLTSTAIKELQHREDMAQLRNQLVDQVSKNKNQDFRRRDEKIPISRSNDIQISRCAATTWTFVTDIELPELGTNQASLSPDHLSRVLKDSIRGKRGAVVVELMPDRLVEIHEKRQYSYSLKGLKAQILTARELVNQAKNDKTPLVITFACEDASVLDWMKTVNLNVNLG